MAFRYGNRKQTSFLPPSIDEYVGIDDPVRAYDAFVDGLDLSELGIDMNENQVGNSEYDPSAMLKLIVYGYSYGQRSSRKLERAIHHNLSFIWLMGGLCPDYKTISNFRKRNRKAISKVMRQCARMCLKLGLIEGNTIFVDGTKMRANASLKHWWTEKRCEDKRDRLDKRIEEILSECEQVDKTEEGKKSLVRLQEELGEKRQLRNRIEEILSEIKREDKSSLNTVDKDCVATHSTHGSYAGYNAQIAVDEKNGLIISSDVLSQSNDSRALSQQITNANENLGKECEVAVADGGYSDLEDLSKVHEETEVLVPLNRQQEQQDGFHYHAEGDFYECPEGHKLPFYRIDEEKKRRRYKILKPRNCRECKRFGTCTRAKTGRTIGRSLYEDTASRIQQKFQRPEMQSTYELRAQKVELPFGFIRRNLNCGTFLLRGLNGVKAEMALLGCAFNITRMISLLGGVEAFVSKMYA